MADLLKMKITPARAGYVAKAGAQVLSAQLDGGAARYRQDVDGATASVSVRWETDKGGFEYLQAFYQLTGSKGLPFTIDLILQFADLTEHLAYFIPDTFQLGEQAGLSFTVSATLEVVPMGRDDDLAQSIVDNYAGSPTPQTGGGLDSATS